MKLTEITFTGVQYTEYTEKELDSFAEHFSRLPTFKKLPHGMVIKKDGDKNSFFALMKKGQLVGWIKFKETNISGKQYNMLEVIYTQPKFRKTSASAHLILHMKDLSQLPIVLGDAYQLGGTLFKDGEDLLISLQKRPKLFNLQLLDLTTGERSSLPAQLKTDKNKTVVIENMLPSGLNEQFISPTGERDFDERQDWLGDVEVDDTW